MYTRRTRSKEKWVILLAAVVALLVAAGAAAWFITPGVPRPRMAQGNITLAIEDDGTVLLSWPETEGLSRVSLRSGSEKDFHLLNEFEGNTATLDAALLDQSLEIRVQGAAWGKNLLGVERERLSRNKLDVTVQPDSTPQTTLNAVGGEEPGELLLSWSGKGSYELGVLEDGKYRALQEISGNSTSLLFGEGQDLPMPGYDDPVRLTLRAVRRGEGYVLYGPRVDPVDVKRELLLGKDLSLECQQLEERVYVLRWNETKGDYYEVQEWSAADERWETLAHVDRDAELCYETGLLRSGSDHRYRVVSVGGDAAVEPAETSLRAEISTRYATIWPVIQLEYFEDAALAKSLGKVPAGTALCVLEESGDAFQVRFKDQYVWVDSRFCMIDLREFVGDVCAYDITNSYSSIFMVHDNPIRSITGEIVPGFEGINTAEDGFLVPYLYPCAKKLLTAAQAAEKDGYRLRIYEAFRPNEATRFLYDTTEAQLDYPVPVIDEESGEYVFYEPPAVPEPVASPEPDLSVDPEPGPSPDGEVPTGEPDSDVSPAEGNEPVLPSEEGAEPQVDSEEGLQAAQTESPAQPEEPSEPEAPSEPEELSEPEEQNGVRFPGPTFRQVMTDGGRWRLGSFLAAVASAHNRGIALDLTIEYLDGQPLEMQSAMHDLSWYSAVYLNNENADLLASYMTMPGVEMRGLTSEWWHFQDDDTREAIGLSSYLTKGVTAEGWTRDNVGWRYRDAQGNYARNITLKLDGKSWTFDAQGYVIE